MVSNVPLHLLQRDWRDNEPNTAEETARFSASNGDGQILYAANDTSSNDCNHPFRPLKRKLQRTKDENADSKGIGASVNASEFDDAIPKQEAKHTSLESFNIVEHTQMESTFENFFKHAPSSMHLQAYNYFQHYLSKRISDDIRKWDRGSGFSPAIQVRSTRKKRIPHIQVGTRNVLEDTCPSPSHSVMEAFAKNGPFLEFRLCPFLRHSTTLPFLTRNICSSKVLGKNKGRQPCVRGLRTRSHLSGILRHLPQKKVKPPVHHRRDTTVGTLPPPPTDCLPLRWTEEEDAELRQLR